jgi:hypothetical protein
MNEITSIGISLTGVILAAAVLSVLVPSFSGKKLYAALTGVYLIISFISEFKNFSVDFSFEEAFSISSDFEKYGEDLTENYFKENIKTIIEQKSGIDKGDIFIELKKDEDKKLSIEKITVKTDKTKYLEELSKVLGTEIEVID